MIRPPANEEPTPDPAPRPRRRPFVPPTLTPEQVKSVTQGKISYFSEIGGFGPSS